MKTIDYESQSLPMADLLISQGVSFKDDFTAEERENLKELLEKYLIDCADGKNEAVEIFLKRFVLRIQGSTEAGHLYSWLLKFM